MNYTFQGGKPRVSNSAKQSLKLVGWERSPRSHKDPQPWSQRTGSGLKVRTLISRHSVSENSSGISDSSAAFQALKIIPNQLFVQPWAHIALKLGGATSCAVGNLETTDGKPCWEWQKRRGGCSCLPYRPSQIGQTLGKKLREVLSSDSPQNTSQHHQRHPTKSTYFKICSPAYQNSV